VILAVRELVEMGNAACRTYGAGDWWCWERTQRLPFDSAQGRRTGLNCDALPALDWQTKRYLRVRFASQNPCASTAHGAPAELRPEEGRAGLKPGTTSRVRLL